jgi:anti-anti-sigma factor
VRVRGDLDDAGTAALDDVVDRRLDESAPYRLVLDLSRVTLLASAAQGLLLRLHRRCRVRNVHLVLVGTAQPAVDRPLRLSGLLPLFDIRPTVEAAICVHPARALSEGVVTTSPADLLTIAVADSGVRPRSPGLRPR